MDVLYIVGNRLSQWQNNELRYSLRSIARNAEGLGRVFIAGYIPEFVNQEAVECIYVKDQSNVKHVNILRAIDVAIKATDIGKDNDGEFLYSSDDHFYIQPCNFEAYPFYWRGEELPDSVKAGDRNAVYHTTLASTATLLKWCGLPAHMFAWHGNTHFNARLWGEERFQFILRNAYEMPEACEPTCLMCNYWLDREPDYVRLQMVSRPDYKFNGGQAWQIPDREVVSAHDNIAHTGMADYLRQAFPKKCRFER